MLQFYGHVCAHGKQNGPSDLQKLSVEVKEEAAFLYSPAGVWA